MLYIGIDHTGNWKTINEEDIFNESMLEDLEHLIMPYKGEKIILDRHLIERDIFLRVEKDGIALTVYSIRKRNSEER